MVKICFGLARSQEEIAARSHVAKICTINHCNLIIFVCVLTFSALLLDS